jgi:hypothetical protein
MAATQTSLFARHHILPEGFDHEVLSPDRECLFRLGAGCLERSLSAGEPGGAELCSFAPLEVSLPAAVPPAGGFEGFVVSAARTELALSSSTGPPKEWQSQSANNAGCEPPQPNVK